MALSRKYHKPLAEIAKANNIQPHTMVKVGDRIVIPGVPRVAAAPQVTPPPTRVAATPQPQVQQPQYAAAQPRRRPRAW